MPELTQSFGFDLTYAFTRYIKLTADLLEGVAPSVPQTESQADDLFLSRSKGFQHCVDVLIGDGFERRLVGGGRFLGPG